MEAEEAAGEEEAEAEAERRRREERKRHVCQRAWLPVWWVGGRGEERREGGREGLHRDR